MKQYILVAGVDYEFNGDNFKTLCDNRMKSIISKNQNKEELKFTILDFVSGAVSQNDVTYVKGVKKETKTTIQQVKGITSANYVTTTRNVQNHFKPGQEGTLSIVNVYEYVMEIGSGSDKGTLAELSFFSHGWMGGPILVNSFDDRNASSGNSGILSGLTLRNPDDKDPRAEFDFADPNMEDKDVKNFQAAFDKDGIVWAWGCAQPQPVNNLLYKIETNGNYSATGVKDETVFQLDNLSSDQINNILKATLQGLLVDSAYIVSASSVKLKFKFIKYVFARISKSTYSIVIASVSKVKTYGALVGTAAMFEPSSGANYLMKINPVYRKNCTFYKNYLGFKLDPEGRNYGEYLPSMDFPTPTVP